ncbi:MAG: hypothetical protein Q9209_006707 [Squamulea sp. 1 TL-2023]
MAVADVSPWKAAKDSPSRQLLWELSRLVLVEQEESYEKLDQASRERGAVLRNALDDAAARHDKVRRDAEAERDRLILEQAQKDAEIRRQEEERRREAEAEREKAEKRRLAERAQAAERAERAATQEREAEEARLKAEKERRDAQAARAKQEEKEAAERRKAEEDRKAREAAAAARSTPPRKPATSTTEEPTPSIQQETRLDPDREKEHERYLEIHKALKKFRGFMAQQAKHNPQLKQRMGDMRRGIKKSVGQLREGGASLNRKQLTAIFDTLGEALKSFPEPKVSLATLIARPIQDVQAPALVIFLLNHFSKSVIAQLIKEAAVSPTIADAIGTTTVNVFAKDDYRVNGISLIDILMAKFHVVCPPLFGIYGSESTEQGRERLGWWREYKGGPWVSTQIHQDRMTGLGAGYAAISLRNFENSRMSNPYPPYHYWQTLVGILNVPKGQVTDTHLVLLRALLANSESRFFIAYGESAKQLLQYALKDYPQRAPNGSTAASLLSNLGNTMKKDKKLYL